MDDALQQLNLLHLSDEPAEVEDLRRAARHGTKSNQDEILLGVDCAQPRQRLQRRILFSRSKHRACRHGVKSGMGRLDGVRSRLDRQAMGDRLRTRKLRKRTLGTTHGMLEQAPAVTHARPIRFLAPRIEAVRDNQRTTATRAIRQHQDQEDLFRQFPS